MLSSEALPLREFVEASFLSCAATGAFAVGLAAALGGATVVGGGAYFAVLRYESISHENFEIREEKGSRYLDVRIVNRTIYSPAFQRILVHMFWNQLAVA